MKTSKNSLWFTLAALLFTPVLVQAQGTAFTYQGRLNDGASPATGTYDLTFSVWTNASGPAQMGGTLTNAAVGVTNGLFTVAMDFGSVFDGTPRWLEIGVRTNGAVSFNTLSPRQKIAPAPYAVTAGNVVNSGGGLTNLNAAAIASGTVADARLSTNIARLNANQTFTGINLFTNNVGVGTLTPIYPVDLVADGFGLVHENRGRAVGTFVDLNGGWLGTLTDDPLSFFVDNSSFSSLTINTNGFVGIGTPAPDAPLNVVAQFYGFEHDGLGVSLATYIDGVAGWFGTVTDHPLYLYVNNNSNPSLTIATNGFVGIGTNNPAQALHVVGNILATGTVTGSSDRNLKENFRPVDPLDVLGKVAALPISRWNYKTESDVAHLGPMAQDFYSAFTVGMDDKHISMVDADGVALAAIQGLNQKLEDKEARIRDLEARLERLERLEKMLSNGDEKH